MSVLTTQFPIRLLQITDSHLYASDTGTLLKLNTHASLLKVIELVQQRETDIDLILATGDIAQDASAQAYQHFMDAVSVLDAPFRWIPGNHDDAALMAELSSGSEINNREERINNWQIVLLDTSIDGQVHGRLADSELEFLQSSLQAAQDDEQVDHCLICLHHNPIPGTAGWMEDIGLHNAAEFFEVVKKFDKLRCAVYGHIHQNLDIERQGIRCLCAPSTCIQFKQKAPGFALDEKNPGYRWLHLFEDGSIETAAERVTDYALEIDLTAEGY